MTLRERAEQLGIKFDDEIADEDLQKLVDDKTKELENDIDHWKAEAVKWETEAKNAFVKRDKFKGDRELLAKKIKDMEASMKGMIPSEEKDVLTEELKELKSFKEDIDKKKEEKDLANKTEVERLQLQITKNQEGFQTQLDTKFSEIMKESEAKDKTITETREEMESLRFNGLEAAIVTEAARLDAWSPQQIFLLTKDKFTYDKDLGKFTYQNRDAGNKLVDEMSVGEFVEDFLKQEENENLIKSRVNTTSLKTDQDETKHKKSTEKLGTYNPKDPNIIRNAELNSMSPERYIKVVLLPKDKLDSRGEEDE